MMTRPGQQVVFSGLSTLFPRYFPCSWPEARGENPAGIWPLEACLSARLALLYTTDTVFVN